MARYLKLLAACLFLSSVAHGQTILLSKFGPVNGILVGAAGNPATTVAVAGNVTPLFGCGGNSSLFLNGGGGCTAPASVLPANPSGLIGLTAVNGTAATFARSDATHALDQSIVPTWTGVHTFSAQVNFNAGVVGNGATGGSQGPGTFNMTGCFVNGVACSVGGSSGVTSISAGTGITLSPSPITATGSVSINSSVVPLLSNVSNVFNSGTGNTSIFVKAGTTASFAQTQINTAGGVRGAMCISGTSNTCETTIGANILDVNADSGMQFTAQTGSIQFVVNGVNQGSITNSSVPWLTSSSALNGTNITTGTVADARLTSNVPLKNVGLNLFQAASGNTQLLSRSIAAANFAQMALQNSGATQSGGICISDTANTCDTSIPANVLDLGATVGIQFTVAGVNQGNITSTAVPWCNLTGAGVANCPITGVSQTNGSFTSTLSTGCTTTPTQTISWVKIGSLVTLTTRSSGLAYANCTSNSADRATDASIPVQLRPAVDLIGGTITVNDNSVSVVGCMVVRSTGVLRWGRVPAAGTSCGPPNMTTSGTTGIDGFTISYTIL